MNKDNAKRVRKYVNDYFDKHAIYNSSEDTRV